MIDSQTSISDKYQQFFQRQILSMIDYWRDHASVQNMEIPILDQEREAILKAMTLALDLELAWSSLYPLITAFTPYMERRGYWDAWNTVLKQAITTAQRHNDSDSEITLTALQARICQRQSQPQQTIYHYRRVIRLARQAKNRFEEARACSNLGYLYIDKGHWWRAEVLSCHALNLFEGLNSDHGRAHTHNHLGLLFIRVQKWKEAEAHLLKAYSLWQQSDEKHGLIHGLINLGTLFNEKQSFAKSIFYLKKALHQARITGEEGEIAIILMNIGVAQRHDGDLANAEKNYLESQTIFRRFENSLGLAQIWANLGEIYTDLKKWDEAQHYLQESLSAFRILGNATGEAEVLSMLTQLTSASKQNMGL